MSAEAYDQVGVPCAKTTTGPLPTSVTERVSPSATSMEVGVKGKPAVMEIVNRA